ncbi:intraflagellar transport protein 140 homolog [Microplitis demolitor]|uniref:intraflagellar transport protein 140 homolog n=1 Tax=Microplitis demolitor TaxID=69319 RepID=UPI0004CD6701|nr:intraflagellar transport protein 140 homolog [Microplitis demolitor]
MSLYFDNRIQNLVPSSINTFAIWHMNFPLLAVAAYSQNKGGFITIYNDHGELIHDLRSLEFSTFQISALSWHPNRKLLIVGKDNGSIKLWDEDSESNEFSEIGTPHRDSISILEWSQHGGRLISADTSGSLVGWRVDNKGQLLIMFHHDLKKSFIHIAFRSISKSYLNNVAKTGIVEDERALNLFGTWRPRTAVQTPYSQKDNYAFFIGSLDGILYYIDAKGHCKQVLNTDGLTLYGLLHHQSKDSIVVMTEGLNICQFQIDPFTGELTELIKVKLSCKNNELRTRNPLCWIGNNTLAILTGELDIRCWNLQNGNTYVLSPLPTPSSENISTSQEVCTSFTYCKINKTLAAGTNLGTVYFWKREFLACNNEYGWPTTPKFCNVHGTVKELMWGGAFLRHPVFAVNCITNVFILHEQHMCAAYNDDVCVSQISPTKLIIEEENQSFSLLTDIQVQILATNKNYVVISSGKQIVVYRINRNEILNTSIEQSFNCDAEKILIYESTLIILTTALIQLKTIKGNVIQNLPALPEEGEPITMELTAQYLTVASLNGILKIWDLSKRLAKLHTRTLAVSKVIKDFAEVIEAKCNSDCRCVSITVATSNLLPSSILYIWDIEGDQIFEFDFAQLSNSYENYAGMISKSQGRFIITHCWDVIDPRVLVCQIQTIENYDTRNFYNSQLMPNDIKNTVFISMFVTPEHGITIHDYRSIEDSYCRLIEVKSPFIIALNPEKENNRSKLTKLFMREFEDLGVCDETIKTAIMDFSFYISMANTDEAFKSIKAIKNEAVWKSLAKICVKTKQLNMAVICLGHMKFVRGTKAFKQGIHDPSLNLEAKIGILAVELGLYADAKRLFREAKRLDLLGSFLETCHRHSEAITLAENENKISEKLSYYNYAKILEQQGNVEKAIKMYTKANSDKFQVPKILLSQPKELHSYFAASNDKETKNWYAQYVESTRDIEGALRLYEDAKNTLAVTRLLCYLGRDGEACDLVIKTNHAASAYHLAAHYESINNISQAVHFYTVSKAYTNAIRICKENGMIEELWPLSVLAPRQLKIDIAKYYEDNEQSDKAILLYHQSGLLPKALSLAFNTQQYDSLQLITSDLNSDTDPMFITKCAYFFEKNNQIEKAIQLLAKSKEFIEVLNLIQKYNVPLTEDLAEQMTTDKVANDMESEHVRILTLEKVGEIAFEQGNYHLATKKFTQAGNKLKAMKALLKSGDTEKICFFAQVSRQRDIYIMAGNYLQSLDWQNQPNILKNIINFYSKAKAMDLLSNFYVACAQVEIDEFQNYEKAIDAFNQAIKCMSQVTSPKDHALHKHAVDAINTKIMIIKHFLDIKQLFTCGATEQALFQIRQLLNTHGDDLEKSVRIGDVFSTITQHYIDLGDLEKARNSIKELKRLKPEIHLNYFYNTSVLESLGYQRNTPRETSPDKDNKIDEFLD